MIQSRDGTAPLLEVRHLTTVLATEEGEVRPVDDVSFLVHRGETVGLVGETGCGKSMTARSVLRLLPPRIARIAGGEVRLNGRDLTRLPEREMRRIRGARIGMVFQDPMTYLDPLMTIGAQLAEVIREHRELPAPAVRVAVVEALGRALVPAPEQAVHAYAHELSGGMRQRVLIALAIAGQPELLIADEPTTALDVTTQAQILALLRGLVREGGSLLLVTHDLGVVANMCDRVYVMYAGQIVEALGVRDLLARPRHPYTQGLVAAASLAVDRDGRFASIPGVVPDLRRPAVGCRFRERCGHAVARCSEQNPVTDLGGGDAGEGAACWLYAP